MANSVFRLDVLPARIGDALVIEYGPAGQTQRILIDGGTRGSADGVAGVLGPDAPLELLVVTHIDNDHAAGVLRLLERPQPPVPAEVWFNGYRHFREVRAESMGPVEGERLTTLILNRQYPWNAAFGRKAVVRDEPPVAPPTHRLPGGMTMTVLSPGYEQLRILRPVWEKVIREAGLDPQLEPDPEPPPTRRLEAMGAPDLDVEALAAERTDDDAAPANGSSIALLAEYAGKRCLLAGDAHPRVLIAGIDALVGPTGVLEVDVFKLPHHGSKANVSIALMQRVQARTYVFSTDGTGNQRHPNDQAVARVVMHGGSSPELVFNYRSDRNAKWADPPASAPAYRTRYPAEGSRGITVDLMQPPASRPAVASRRKSV